MEVLLPFQLHLWSPHLTSIVVHTVPRHPTTHQTSLLPAILPLRHVTRPLARTIHPLAQLTHLPALGIPRPVRGTRQRVLVIRPQVPVIRPQVLDTLQRVRGTHPQARNTVSTPLWLSQTTYSFNMQPLLPLPTLRPARNIALPLLVVSKQPKDATFYSLECRLPNFPSPGFAHVTEVLSHLAALL